MGPMMNSLLRVSVVALLIGLGVSALAAPRPSLPPAERDPDGPKYASMARCNTKDCHGADAAKGSPALNEYTLWKAADPHSKAFTTLYKAPSKAIGTAMAIAKVHESAKCLSCHSKVVEPANVVEGQKWSVQNGVSCEVCHGPSEKWIDPHATPKEKAWSHEKSIAAGMDDLRDPVAWTAKCASCHLQIDHDMVTAGHPRLHFEIVDYNARTGAHWKTEKHPSMQAGFDAKIWTIGQAVSYAEALRNVEKRIAAKAPEEGVREAREQAAAHRWILKQVAGFADTEVPVDAEKQAKSLAPADESVLGKLGDAPKSFAAARQAALAFRALSKKADAKAAIDKMCEQIAPKNEATFDAGQFAADYDAVKKLFK
jgi:hypothetical protein